MTLRAGVARTDITPPVGIAHGGWGAQDHERAAGIDLPLWATALALEDDGAAAVVVDVDLVYIWEEDAAQVRERVAELTGLRVSAIRLSYTHTHSGPYTPRESWIDAGSEMVDPYLDSLPDRIAGAALGALKSTRPVNLAAGMGTCEIAVNRRVARPEDGRIVVGRNPEGPVDHDVGVVRLDDRDGEPLATIAHYACHPTTVGPDNTLITPDYPGVAKRVVEEATGATCLFLQGAAGDVGPIYGTARDGIDEYRILGRRLGHETARVWHANDPRRRESSYAGTLESGAPLAMYDDEPSPESHGLSVATRDLELPVRDLPAIETAEREYGTAQDRLEELREEGADEEEVRAAQMHTKRAKIQRDLASEFGDSEHLVFELQAITFGEVALVAMPGEPFVETALRIKESAPFQTTLFSGYSNVGHCYVPTADAYDDGGYEVNRTPVRPGAVDRIVSETVDQLETLAD